MTGTAGSKEFKLVVAKAPPSDFDHVLSTIIDWTTGDNHAKCMVKKISLCLDNTSVGNVNCAAAPSQPTAEAIRISPGSVGAAVTRNTVMESIDSTTIEPRLIIKRDTPTATEEEVIYIKGEIPHAGIYDYITLKLTICGNTVSWAADVASTQNKNDHASPVFLDTGDYVQEIDVVDYVSFGDTSGETRNLN